MENNNLEFNELLNDLEPHIFNFILENLSDLPSELSKDEQVEFITSNYSQGEIEDLIEEYDIFEIETTETLNSLEDEIFELIEKDFNIADLDREEAINHIITNCSKDQIENAIYKAESGYETSAELEELDDFEFALIARHFGLSKELDERESMIDYLLENYSISQINTAMEIASKKKVFYEEMLNFDDDVFSFICFNYSSLDYNSFKSLESQETRRDKACYLISHYSPYELNQKARDFAAKSELFNSLNGLDEVLFRILIRNMNAYSFFLTRLDIIYNLMINYSDYIIYIEMDKAKADFRLYDDLRNLEDMKLLFIANYLNAPKELIESWIEESDLECNYFEDYDINPKNHIISFNIKDDEELEESEEKKSNIFNIKNYFDVNPMELSIKDEIAYYIYQNKSADDVVEALNSFPNLIVDSEGNVIEDSRGDNISDENASSNIESDVETNVDNSIDNMEEDNMADDSVGKTDDEMAGDSKDDLEDSGTVNVDIEDENPDKTDEIEVKISDQDNNPDDSDNDSNDDESTRTDNQANSNDLNEEHPEVSEEEYSDMLNKLDEAVFKILIRKLGIVENNKVAIIDHIMENYTYEEIESITRMISFRKDLYTHLASLDDVTFILLLKEFSAVPKNLGRFEKIDFIVSNYAPVFIESKIKDVQSEINTIKLLLKNEDIFFEIAKYFKLPLHATKDEQIDYLLTNYSLPRIRNRISLYGGKQRIGEFISGIVDKDKIICPNCGRKVKNDSKFCTNCGTRLSVNINID